MNSTVLMGLSISVTPFLGFTTSVVLTPDPTGVLPVVLELVLTGVLCLAFYAGTRRILAPNRSST